MGILVHVLGRGSYLAAFLQQDAQSRGEGGASPAGGGSTWPTAAGHRARRQGRRARAVRAAPGFRTGTVARGAHALVQVSRPGGACGRACHRHDRLAQRYRGAYGTGGRAQRPFVDSHRRAVDATRWLQVARSAKAGSCTEHGATGRTGHGGCMWHRVRSTRRPATADTPSDAPAGARSGDTPEGRNQRRQLCLQRSDGSFCASTNLHAL